MKNWWIICLIAFLPGILLGQEATNKRHLTVFPVNDTIILDSLSIIPRSEELIQIDQVIPATAYSIDYINSVLVINHNRISRNDSLKISFSVFPVRLNKTYRYLESNQNRIIPTEQNSLLRSQNERASRNRLNSGSLFTSGDLSRGVQIGNNQDASLNSSLNLKISGQINEQFSIEAHLSDANLPIQPEGNTAQLQEFDRLYIRLFSEKTQIQAGDFVLNSDHGYFLRMQKNLQGITVSTHGGKAQKSQLSTKNTAAVVKGKFNRMKINGTEGNQGPYRLIGAEQELYIQVIAGSEKVYIDGELLNRGENEDYVINYNTAELRFTPRNLITKNKRITIEFEYTDRTYARFIVASENSWKTENGSLYLNLFNESDAKNQTLLQDLSSEQKTLLSQIGDQLDKAVVDNYYQSGFTNDRVLYKKTDTLVNGQLFEEVLVYSTHPDSAVFQAGFSFVGPNRGNYNPVQSTANGQVYQWVAPLDGIAQGAYEPVTRLITPKSKQIYTLGGSTQLDERTTFRGELSFTANNLNTFSDKDNEDNMGTGILGEINRSDPIKADSSLMLNSFVKYRYVGHQFDALEPFRSVEFERDWNLAAGLPGGSENFLQGGVRLLGGDRLQAGYQIDYLNYQDHYSALRNRSSGQVIMGPNKLTWNASLMNSDNTFRQTRFLRHRIDLARSFSFFKLSISENFEGNQWKDNNSAALQDGSFRFQEWKAELAAVDQSKLPWFVHVKWRKEDLPDSSGFIRSFESVDQAAGLSFSGSQGQSTRISWNYRKLNPVLEQAGKQAENSTTIRAEEQFSLWKGLIRSGTFYELGSGLERKQDYYYLEVPAGQGYYTWSDYNQNNIKELDEFEPAVFSDQAAYIRVFRPGTDYVPVFINRLTQTVNFQPAAVNRSSSMLDFFKHFKNQFAFTANRRSYQTDFFSVINPFMLADSLIVSNQSTLRNNLTFNTKNRKFAVDYLIQQTKNQILMTYGSDNRRNQSNAIVITLRPWQPWLTTNQSETGTTAFESEFFTNRNYVISFLRNTLNSSLELSDQTRVNLKWILAKEENTSGLELSRQNQLELGGDYQMPGKGVIHLDMSYIHFDFSGDPDTPVGYVMLKGFRPGHNGMANMSLRRKINEVVQLDLQYGVRFSGSNRWIHTGNVVLRAIF